MRHKSYALCHSRLVKDTVQFVEFKFSCQLQPTGMLLAMLPLCYMCVGLVLIWNEHTSLHVLIDFDCILCIWIC